MKLFLIQDVKNLGRRGETIEVNDGFARNFLLPKKMAVLPTDSRTKDIIEEKKSHQIETKKQQKELEDRVKEIEGKTFNFKVKADKNGQLYGSLGPKELAQSIGINEKLIKDHIKKIGEYLLSISFGTDLNATIKIVVEKEK